MENQKKSQVSLKQESELITILDALFPEQKIDIEGSNGNTKAKLTFNIMLKDKWNIEEFEEVMEEFVRSWNYQNWLPANIIQIKDKKFPNQMVI